MGSYYVLEVGNFDQSPGLSGMEQGQAGVEQGQAGMDPDDENGGYFVLNTDDPSLSITNEDGSVYSSVPSRLKNYENALVFQPSAVSASAPKDSQSKLHPHLVIANEDELERSGQASSLVKSEGRASMYENVCPPTEREAVPVPVAASSVGVALEPGKVGGTADNKSVSYENINLRQHSAVSDISPAYSQVTKVKRSAQQRKEVYEVVPIRGQKVNGIGSRHSSNRSPETSKSEIYRSIRDTL